MTIFLNASEIAELNRQKPSTKDKGGFQALLVGLQLRVDGSTGELMLTDGDLSRIARYAFDYRKGGWQGRLMRVFGRTLGPNLGRQQTKKAA